MMSATLVSAGAASSGYYKAEGYYAAGSQEAEQAASWFGRAAEQLGLSGRVDDALFTRMLDGQTFTTESGRLEPQRLMGRIQDGERKHRPGLDLTFSAPKSVSIAALVYNDERLIEAHDKAVKVAMAHVQDHLVQTRTFVNGELTVQTGGNIVAGLFRHDTSRLLDPQLHTHAVIANQVYHANGDATAIHNSLIFQAQKLGSEIYRNELARSATELGYQVAREGEHRLLVLRDIPKNLVTAFSKRSEEMKAALHDRDMPINAKTAELAALATRAAKHQDLDRAQLHRAWAKEAGELGISRDQMRASVEGLREKARFHVPGQARDGSPTDPARDARLSLQTAISHLSENNLHYSRIDLTTAALSFAKHAGEREIDTAIRTSLKSGALVPVKIAGRSEDMLTDAGTLQVEKEIGQEFRRGIKSVAVTVKEYATGKKIKNMNASTALSARLSRTTLSDGQKDAVTTALSDAGRVVGVQGSAGTGKTFMLAHLRKEAERAGYDVKGLAPSTQAVTQLQEALPGAETLQSHLMRRGPAGETNPKKTIYVVDEASMIGNTQMRDFLRLAADSRVARVVLVGDVQQLDSVSAGTPFALLEKMGMPTAVMDDIQRQRNETSLAIVKHAIAGEVNEAFDKIGDRISESSNPARVVAQRYLALNASDRASTGILTPTNASREDINSLIREGLRAEGTLRGSDAETTVLRPIRLTRAQLSDPDSWRTGDVVLAHQSYKAVGLAKGHTYEVLSSDANGQSVTLKDRGSDELVTLPLSQSSKSTASVELFEEHGKSFAAGDQIKFRIGDKASGISNGLAGEITDITTSHVHVMTSDGDKKMLSRSSLGAAGLDHAYALTGHDFQGATVDNILVAMSATETLANQKSFYVAVSRARDTVSLATDDAAALAERLERQTGQTTPALEAWLAARLERDKEAMKMDREDRTEQRENERENDPEPVREREPQKEVENARSERSEMTDGDQTRDRDERRKQAVLSVIQETDKTDLERMQRIINQKQLGDFER